jgi:hypothetical protein
MEKEQSGGDKAKGEVSSLGADNHLGIVAEPLNLVASVSTTKKTPQVSAGVFILLR